jgi:hypothetical protein
MLVCAFLHNFARETAGAARTRLSLRPLFEGGEEFLQRPGRDAPRGRERVSGRHCCLKFESVGKLFARSRATPSTVITREGG